MVKIYLGGMIFLPNMAKSAKPLMAKKEKQSILTKNDENPSQNDGKDLLGQHNFKSKMAKNFECWGYDFRPKVTEHYEQLTFIECEFFDIVQSVEIYEFFYYIQEFWNPTSTMDMWIASEVNFYDMVCKTTMVKKYHISWPKFCP